MPAVAACSLEQGYVGSRPSHFVVTLTRKNRCRIRRQQERRGECGENNDRRSVGIAKVKARRAAGHTARRAPRVLYRAA